MQEHMQPGRHRIRLSKGALLATMAMLAIVASLWAPPRGHAHEGAKGIIAERMGVMDNLKLAMQELIATTMGWEYYEPETVKEAAQEIREGTNAFLKLFPKDGPKSGTGALPEIWKDWKGFASLANQLASYAETLEKVADKGPGGMGAMMGGQKGSGAMTAAAGDDNSPRVLVARMAEVCQTCHMRYRSEKEPVMSHGSMPKKGDGDGDSDDKKGMSGHKM